MFKVPTNQDILDFIAQHVDVEVIAKGLKERTHQEGSRSDTCVEGMGMRTKGRSKYLSELSDFNQIRGRVDDLVPAISLQMARLSSDDIETQQRCADHLFKQFRLLECVYSSIRQRPIYTLTEQSAGNLAMVEFFLLPYLKRVSHELNQAYPNNFLFYYLKRYVDVVFASHDNPMAAFISEHKQAFGELSDDTTYLDGYRRDRYKKLSVLLKIKPKKSDNVQDPLHYIGWHIAGNIIHSILRSCADKRCGEWCDESTLLAISMYEDEYDFVYKKFLSLSAEETVLNTILSDSSAEVQSIVKIFMTHVDGYELVDDFISETTVKKTHRTLYKTLKEKQTFLYDFCQRVSSGEVQSKDEVACAQYSLDVLRKCCHLGHDAFSFAHYIFVAKYQNGEAKKNGLLYFCEQVMLESGVDPFTESGLNFTVGNVDDIDMTYAEHMRCRYVGYFNWLLKTERSRYDFINPIVEVERFLLSVIQPVHAQADPEDRVYTLVEKALIVKSAKQVKNPCVGVMKFDLKTVVANLRFFEYVFQLYYPWPEEDSDVPGNGILRYSLLTEQQKIALLEAIPSEPNRLNDVDIDLIPVL